MRKKHEILPKECRKRSYKKCCGSGFGIRCLLCFIDPWIRDSDQRCKKSGTRMNIPDIISESLETILLTLDPGWKNPDPGIRYKHPGSANTERYIQLEAKR
jgi:hypothetical protein